MANDYICQTIGARYQGLKGWPWRFSGKGAEAGSSA
jgi:hypothetical protein